MKKIIQCSLIITFIFGYGISVFAKDVWEDVNTPLSFRIELLPWEEVDEILPNKSKFAIIDVETGLLFHVQRRAGSRHADVQPLTSEDTMIMKKIYNGKWSWNRKAIIVLAGDKMIAASMSGMPHGAGALKNNFRGHFCVHFFGSTTHRSNRVDPAHQLMILKASGKLEDYLQKASINEVLQAFAVGVNQKDETLFHLVSTGYECKGCFEEMVKNVSYFNFVSTEDISNDDGLFVKIMHAKVEYLNEQHQKVRKTIDLLLQRGSPYEQWQIDLKHVMSAIE